MEPDPLKELYSDLLEGDYDCVDRFVLNAYSPFGVRPGGFRHWWRLLHGSDEGLDNEHFAGTVLFGLFATAGNPQFDAHGGPLQPATAWVGQSQPDPGDRLRAGCREIQDR